MKRGRDELVEQLIVGKVLDRLFSQTIINQEEYQKIKVKETEEERVRTLLDLIPVKGQRAYDELLTFLSSNKPWLYRRLIELNDSITEGMSLFSLRIT